MYEVNGASPDALPTSKAAATMTDRIRKDMDERDQGFTLIELLVIIIIIGILAAIAIPVFLNQRKKGVDASLKSDLKNAATAAETYTADNPTATNFGTTSAEATAIFAANGFKASPGNTVKVNYGGPATGYRLCAYNPGATTGISNTAATGYDTSTGGLVTDRTIGCIVATWLTIS